jgi:hypothetical protein
MNKIRRFICNNPSWIFAGIVTLAVVVGLPYAFISNHNEHRDICQSYCQCQEQGNCSYTFDYTDVKDCGCK